VPVPGFFGAGITAFLVGNTAGGGAIFLGSLSFGSGFFIGGATVFPSSSGFSDSAPMSSSLISFGTE
jgi:hypothetical protein